MYKCPICNGTGKITEQKKKELAEYLRKARDFDSLVKKHSVELQKKEREIEINLEKRYEKKYGKIIRDLEERVEKFKKASKRQKPAQEIGAMNVDRFLERVKQLHIDTEDEIFSTENSRPDVMHVIKENGEVVGRFIYELKDRKMAKSDTKQTKKTKEEFKVDGCMLIVKEMPKALNGSHLDIIDNVMVAQFNTAIPLTRILRDQFISQMAIGKTRNEAFKYIKDFVTKRDTVIETANEIGNNTKHMLESLEKFNTAYTNFYDEHKKLLDLDKENVRKIKMTVNCLEKISREAISVPE